MMHTPALYPELDPATVAQLCDADRLARDRYGSPMLRRAETRLYGPVMPGDDDEVDPWH